MASHISSATDNVANSKRLLEAFSSGEVAVADELIDPQAVGNDRRRPPRCGRCKDRRGSSARSRCTARVSRIYKW